MTDIDTFIDMGNGNYGYVVGIRPTLRDVITAQMRVDWWRPRCLMKIKAGSDPMMLLQSYWMGKTSLEFIEAF